MSLICLIILLLAALRLCFRFVRLARLALRLGLIFAVNVGTLYAFVILISL